jgi:hypothetical protein
MNSEIIQQAVMKNLTILLLTILFISCDRNKDEINTDIFEVTTVGIGIDCNLILIEFKECDSARIVKITQPLSLSYGLVYYAYNLDKDIFSASGQILSVRVRKTYESELYACTTLEIGYPWVTVLDAKPKD